MCSDPDALNPVTHMVPRCNDRAASEWSMKRFVRTFEETNGSNLREVREPDRHTSLDLHWPLGSVAQTSTKAENDGTRVPLYREVPRYLLIVAQLYAPKQLFSVSLGRFPLWDYATALPVESDPLP